MIKCGCNPTDPCDDCIEASFDPMITATQHLEASPKPSYGPHKVSERYLDDEDDEQVAQCYSVLAKPAYVTTVDELLFSIERLRTHLRKKYYAG